MEKEILIIDGDGHFVSLLKSAHWLKGVKIVHRPRLSSGIQALKAKSQIVLLGDNLPDGTHTGGLAEIIFYYPESVVILLCSSADDTEMFKAIETGAFHCIRRPVDIAYLCAVIKKADMHLGLIEKLRAVKRADASPPEILVASNEMQKIAKQIEKIPEQDKPVIVIGEEGTGRSLIAKNIHYKNSKITGQFVSLTASDIKDENDFIKLFDEAKGGTLFIKDLSAIPSGVFSKLLSAVLEYKPGGLRLIGSVDEHTDTDIFKDWLKIKIPPLRKRKEDIIPLARYFIKECAQFFSSDEKQLSRQAGKALLDYDWPENTRELKSIVRRAYIFSKGETIEKDDILLEGIGSFGEFLEGKLRKFVKGFGEVGNSNIHDIVMSEVEKSLIGLVLDETGGNKLKTSKVLGISRNTLMSKIKTYKIKPVKP